MKELTRLELKVLLLIVLAGLCLRYVRTARNFIVTPDSTEYLAAATGFERDGGSALKESVRQPLYPLALWAGGRTAELLWEGFSWQNDRMAEVGRLLGAVLYLPFLLAAWLFFRQIGGGRVAAICLFVVVVHPLFGGYFANVLSETLYLTFFAAGLACLVRATRAVAGGGRTGSIWALGVGVSAALAYLTRVEGQILLMSALCCLVAAMGRGASAPGRNWAAKAKAPLCSIAGFLLPAVPVMLYFGATSQRYSWEWFWRRLSAASAASPHPQRILTAGIGFAVTPIEATYMMLSTLFDKAPLVTCGAVAAAASFAVRHWRKGSAASPGAASTVVFVTIAWYAVVIVAGVSLQNAAVPQRYVQPLVLMALPLVVKFANDIVVRRTGGVTVRRRTAVVITAAALVVWFAAFAEARGRWHRAKTGFRDAGAAVAGRAPGERLFTASPRLAYYGGGAEGIVSRERLVEEILEGRAGGYTFVTLETRTLAEEDLGRVTEALRTQGYGEQAWLDIREDSVKEHADRRILIFRREPVLE